MDRNAEEPNSYIQKKALSEPEGNLAPKGKIASARFLPGLIFLMMSVFLFLPNAWAKSPLPRDAVEVTYVWKRGDSLSKALYSLGIGRDGKGHRLYGRQGWIARNEDFYQRKNWDTIPEGSHLLIIAPKPMEALPQNPDVGAKETVSKETAVVLPAIPESGEEKAAPETAAEPFVATVPPTPRPAVVLKPFNQPKLKAKPSSKDRVLGLVLLALLILSYSSVRWRLKNVRRRKTSVVANSVLVWLTSNGQHTFEHISLATTLFIGDSKERSMVAYEVMGYFNRDCELLETFKILLKSENKNQVFGDTLTNEQHEFLIKYFYMAPDVMAAVIGSSTLPFLQIRTLRVLSQFALTYPHGEKIPQLAQALAEACARFPALVENPAVRAEVRLALKSLEAAERDQPAA